ncbi:MAG: hypothetical protein ACLTSX_00420 [Collinsella sp.]
MVEAYQSVARTPDLLPVLKENGVVELRAPSASPSSSRISWLPRWVSTSRSRTSPRPSTPDATSAKAGALDRVKIEANDDWEGSEFRYYNEFLFKAEKPFDEDEALEVPRLHGRLRAARGRLSRLQGPRSLQHS